MGKALIVANNGEASYKVSVLYNRAQVEREKAGIEQSLETLEPELEQAQESLGFLELETAEVAMTVNALIDDLKEDGSPVSLTDLISRHNQIRSSRGLSQLTGVSVLHAAAQGHADWLAANNRTGHTGANGSSAVDRITQSGYPWQNGGGYGENVAVAPPDAESAMTAWMNSPGHASNVLNPNWEHIGAGYACRSEGSYKHFWVVVFGSTESSVATGDPAPNLLCAGSRDNVPEAIREQMELLAMTAENRDIARAQVAQLIGRQLEMQQRLAAIARIPEDPVHQAWCADYTDSLAGEVATAVIPGEGTARTIVLPAYHGEHVWAPEKGQMMPRSAMTPAQVFFNAAVLPGWQRWHPLHRTGELTAVDFNTDTATVLLDDDQSSAQELPITQPQRSLSGVPVKYMQCDAEAFVVGDRVVVEFGGDWQTPRVIGFESSPRACPIDWPDLRIRLRFDRTQWDKSAEGTISNYARRWSWSAGCEWWSATRVHSRSSNWTRNIFAFIDPDDQQFVDPETDSLVFGVNIAHESNVGPDYPFWTEGETFDIAGVTDTISTGSNYCVRTGTIYPDPENPTFVLARWNLLAATVADSPDAELCASDGLPSNASMTGLTTVWGAPNTQATGLGAPRDPPGWVYATNPPVGYTVETQGVGDWQTVEETAIVVSSSLLEIESGLVALGLPVEFELSQMVEATKVTRWYDLTAIEPVPIQPGGTAVNWYVRYTVREV